MPSSGSQTICITLKETGCPESCFLYSVTLLPRPHSQTIKHHNDPYQGSTCEMSSLGWMICVAHLLTNLDLPTVCLAGQLGDGSTENHITSAQVAGLSGILSMTAGNLHTCAVLSNGTARCCGHGQYGERPRRLLHRGDFVVPTCAMSTWHASCVLWSPCIVNISCTLTIPQSLTE